MTTRVLCLIALTACQADLPAEVTPGEDEPDPVEPPEACLEAPAALDFGRIAVRSDPAQLLLSLTNGCDSAVALDEIEASQGSFRLINAGATILNAGATHDFVVELDPQEAGPIVQALSVRSANAFPPPATVELRARVVDTAEAIAVDTESHEFRDLYVGCTATRTVEVTNTTDHPVTIDSIEAFTASAYEYATPVSAPLPWVLEAGGEPARFEVSYRPLDTFADDAFVSVGVNGDGGRSVAEFSGNGVLYGQHQQTWVGDGVTRAFTIEPELVPELIDVKVDGVRINVGWSYDPARGELTFAERSTPAGGATVEVFAQLLGPCVE